MLGGNLSSVSSKRSRGHLRCAEGGARAHYGKRVGIRVLADLQHLGGLDEGRQGGSGAPCLQTTAVQPLLKLTYIQPMMMMVIYL